MLIWRQGLLYSQRPSRQSPNGHASMPAWLVARGNKKELPQETAVALVIFQEYLYILCEFVEHSFETIGSKRHRLSNKMYKYSRF